MSIELRFRGGPVDGHTHAIMDSDPPPRYLVPLPLAELLTPALEPSPIRAAEYEPLWENGWPRRADDGAYLYQYRVPPVTPEERQKLERARQDATAKDAAREAELDEAWQAIRKERPHYPKDRRDAF